MRHVESELETTMQKIRSGIRMRVEGDLAGACSLLTPLWTSVKHGDAFTRLFLAHSLADVQEDPQEELRWDLQALNTYPEVSAERAAKQGVARGVEGLLPSLYLNLGHDYARLGRVDEALEHFHLAVDYLDSLGDDQYGDDVRRAYDEFRVEWPALF